MKYASFFAILFGLIAGVGVLATLTGGIEDIVTFIFILPIAILIGAGIGLFVGLIVGHVKGRNRNEEDTDYSDENPQDMSTEAFQNTLPQNSQSKTTEHLQNELDSLKNEVHELKIQVAELIAREQRRADDDSSQGASKETPEEE